MLSYCRILILLTSIVISSSALKIKPRIINGFDSNRAQFPFYVLLRLSLSGRPSGICGGVLLSNTWILTAAHCLDNADKVQAHFGSWNRERYNEEGRIIKSISKLNFFVHPDYEVDGWHNDIALLRLATPVPLNSTIIEPVYFPHTCSVPEDLDLIAVGNGYIESGTTDLASTLQYTTLTVTSQDRCKEIFRFIDVDHVFCAEGYENEAICTGDSGGPMIHPIQYTLFGITSFSVTDCPPGIPQGFTNIFPYSQWIKAVTGTDFVRC